MATTNHRDQLEKEWDIQCCWNHVPDFAREYVDSLKRQIKDLRWDLSNANLRPR